MKPQIIILILTSLSLLFTACGGSKISKDVTNTDLESRETSNDRTLDLHGKLADCNSFNYPSHEMSGLLTSYYQFNQVVSDKINMRIISLPNKVFNGETKIEMHLWGQENGSQAHDRKNPLSFSIQNIITGQFIKEDYATKFFTEISKSNMEAIINTYNPSWDINLDNFLQKHSLVLYDVSLQYDAINMAEYSISGGSTSNHINFLIPQFYADPQVYINTHDSPLLQEIHPNYPYSQSGWSDEVYFERTEDWCKEFMKEFPKI